MWKPTPMRRKDRALSKEEAEAILAAGEYGILASADADGVPAATPLSHTYKDGVIYCHGAKSGQKIANIAAQPRVSYCVVSKNRPAYVDGDFTTYFESAVAHGTASLVTDPEEARAALWDICQKFLPDYMDNFDEAYAGSARAAAVIRIDVDEVTAKAKKDKPV